MFLATFLIGLREGLEASLIVGILAAFLKRNGASLKGLYIATAAGVALSLLACVVLNTVANGLPQAQQEALETVIGVIAVVFVTTMIMWMKTNARNMKADLEKEAAATLSSGSATAMAGMAFLAIIKEGLETAFFLLAAFQASTGDTQMLAIGGAAAGVVLAVVLGWLIYKGGTKFNIGTFFKVTGPFLILIAAGFAANVFRTAHEAGWVNIGQLQVFDFSAVISNDSVVGSLIQGMFSIQADPRLIEVIVWFAYLVPVLVIYLWPSKYAFEAQRRQMVKRVIAGICAVVAIALFAFYPRGNVADCSGSTRPIENAGSGATSITLVSQTDSNCVVEISYADGTTLQGTLDYVDKGEDNDGSPLINWSGVITLEPSADLPTEGVTLNDLLAINGKLPSGVSKDRTPGPFDVSWSETLTIDIRTSNDNLLRATCAGRLTATLSGGGIDGTKTVNMSNGIDESWSVSDEETKAAEKTLQTEVRAAAENVLYWAWIPAALGTTAVCLVVSSVLDGRKKKAA